MLRDTGCDTSNSDIELILQQFRDLHGQVVDVDLLRISASRVSEPDNKKLTDDENAKERGAKSVVGRCCCVFIVDRDLRHCLSPLLLSTRRPILCVRRTEEEQRGPSYDDSDGALKDQTKVGLAHVNSNFKDVDVAIVKATTHIECPPKRDTSELLHMDHQLPIDHDRRQQHRRLLLELPLKVDSVSSRINSDSSSKESFFPSASWVAVQKSAVDEQMRRCFQRRSENEA
ncbi:hypothetical protein L1887_20314 [Cichorium endivia]|nr:hypothetical protein L1887_20314 [Cichorium endivia]